MEPIEGDPFAGLIQIDEISAQRGFSDASGSSRASGDVTEGRDRRRLSEQFRSYYAKHLDPTEMPEATDMDALEAIDAAQALFDEKLKSGFAPSFEEVEFSRLSRHYRSKTNNINTNPTDGWIRSCRSRSI